MHGQDDCKLEKIMLAIYHMTDGDVPQPYCGAAKCVCPQGYLYDAAGHACVAQPTGKFHTQVLIS